MTDHVVGAAFFRTEWDAVVIGAGVAGCVIARELARAGFRTLLVESKPFPRAKVCGACFNGLALSVFEQVGLLGTVQSAGAEPLKRFEAMLRGRALHIPLSEGLAVSRTVLDPILAESAVAAGVTFRDGTTAVVGPSGANAAFREVRLRSPVGESTLAAKVVIVAAGLGRSCFGPDSVHLTRFGKHPKLGVGCVLSDAPMRYRPGAIHMAIGRFGYLGMVRVENGQLNMAGAFEPAFLKAMGPAAAAAATLEEAGFAAIAEMESAKWIGTPPLTRRTRPLADDRLFLVGDAAGYVEPFTGEGMGWALASAMALRPIAFRAIERWHPRLVDEWARAYELVVGRRQGVCQGIAAILNRPLLAEIAFQAARFAPAVTSRIIRRIDAASPPAFESVSLS